MFRLSCNIIIIDPAGTTMLELPFVNEIEIEKSRKTLTNTAKVTIARKLKVFKDSTQVDINTIIKRGSKIEIQLGYDDNLETKFTGYVARVDAKIPFTIACEDEMWNLKQNSFTKVFGKVKVSEIVSYIYPGAAQVVDLEIGGITIKKASTAQVLLGLKKFGLQCYFDKGILIVDFAGSVHTGKEVYYDFNTNVISNDLEYKRKEDTRIKVRGISKLHSGGKIEIVAGDNDGEEHTLHYVNLDKQELQKIVNAEIDKLKVDGYENGFTTFGIPSIEPGDIAILNDDDYPEHNGSFLIESVKTTFGMSGYRNVPNLERKLA